MAHMLATLRNVPIKEIGKVLYADALQHAKQGLYLEHLWQNVDDPKEVLFLFRVDDVARAKQFIETVHSQALKDNPKANLPHMTFLEE
jgi:hypothetical protein